MTDYLLDTNILLRAVQPETPIHRQAVEAVTSLLERGDNLFVTPQILIEFWAVATRPVEANGLGWSPALALDDRPDIFEYWLKLVSEYEVHGKQVHDTRLVAVMRAHGVNHLLTPMILNVTRLLKLSIQANWSGRLASPTTFPSQPRWKHEKSKLNEKTRSSKICPVITFS